MLQLWGKISVLQDSLTQTQFDIRNVFAYIGPLPTSIINPTLINPPDFWYILCDITDQLRSHPRLQLLANVESDKMELLSISQNTGFCVNRHTVYYIDNPLGW